MIFAMLRIVGRERAPDESHHAAAVTRRAILDAEHDVIADIGDHPHGLLERRLPDLQRVIDPRARRTGGIRLEESFRVCGHDYPLPKAGPGHVDTRTSECRAGYVRFTIRKPTRRQIRMLFRSWSIPLKKSAVATQRYR
jgi:hypothetical protein